MSPIGYALGLGLAGNVPIMSNVTRNGRQNDRSVLYIEEIKILLSQSGMPYELFGTTIPLSRLASSFFALFCLMSSNYVARPIQPSLATIQGVSIWLPEAHERSARRSDPTAQGSETTNRACSGRDRPVGEPQIGPNRNALRDDLAISALKLT